MADHPDKQPTPPDAEQPHTDSHEAPPSDQETTGKAPVNGWHEPAIPDGSSRPVKPAGWFPPPDDADAADPADAADAGETPTDSSAAPDDQAAADSTPAPDRFGVVPEQVGGWFKPPDSGLSALLAGAADTIIERPAAPGPSAPLLPTAPVADPSRTQDDTVGEAPRQTQPVQAEDASPAPTMEPTPAGHTTPAEGITIPPEPDAGTEAEAPAPAEPSAEEAPAAESPAPEPSQFETVERKVDVLRRRYRSGTLTRDELQKELRSLMILDDEGHWWMLGMESNRWYYFDGRDWVPGTPPGHDQRVGGSIVPTETGLQQVVEHPPDDQQVTRGTAVGALDDEQAPLPRRVPQQDPNATLVSTAAPFMEPLRRSDAPTQTNQDEIDLQDEDVVRITRPGGEAVPTHPERPAGDMSQTMPHTPAVDAGARPGDTMRTSAAAAGVAAAASAAQEASRPRKPALGQFPQPDYSAALGASRNRSTYTKWGLRIAVFGIIGGMVLTLLALLGLAGYYFYVIGEYQDVVTALDERVSEFQNTVIFDANGTELAEFINPDTGSRTEVPLSQISPWLIHATIATENETFYTDPGFSVLAIIRASIRTLEAGGTTAGGASTITQQLARALVLDPEFAAERTAERKIAEVIVASEISRQYTKNEILQIYLNEIFYGNFAYGIEAAAQTYFGIPAAELNPAQAAFLAGLPQSPALYDPVINREAAMRRFEDVLRLMSEANGTGCISIQHDDESPWDIPQGGALCVSAETLPDGSIAYYYQTPGMAEPAEMVLDITRVKVGTFQPPAFEITHPHFVNYVWQQLERDYGQAVYGTGYKVYTTLDETIQQSAEQAVTQHLASLNAQGYQVNNASVVSVRPADGAVLAMVGSADYYNDDIDGQVNVAFTGQQPGSSIKPLIYLAALEPDANGNYWTPATVIWDVQTDFNGYVPVNYDRTFRGPQSVREALSNSLNIPAVKALAFVGVEDWTRFAERIGLEFPLGNPIERNAGLTTALGAVEVRLFDMVEAYAMLANNGRRVNPYAIQYIEDSQGNEIFRADTAPQGLQVVRPEYAYLVTNILSDNEARAPEFGRGWPMELSGGRPAALKTGTTNDNVDVWTIGYTPQIVTGVWVGNTDNTPMGGNLTGYRGAAPIWNSVMESAHQGLPIQQFMQPQGVQQFQVCADTGALPTPDCAGRVYVELAAASAPPPTIGQGIIRELQVDEYTGKLANEYCPDLVQTRRYVVLDDAAAYNWINNTGLGQQWAANRGLQVPVMPPPNEYCSPNEPRPTVVVSDPPANATVQGVIPLRGAVMMPSFSRYELRYGVSHTPQAFSEPFLIDTNQRQVADSILGEFDTTQLPNGEYTLRLVAIDQFGRSVTRDIPITINNIAPTPAPTIAPTITPIPGSGSVGNEPLAPATPTLAPTFTATWTLTPTPG